MATNAILLDNEAFSRLVIENGLKTYEHNEYIYAGMREKDGWRVYRTAQTNWDALPVLVASTVNPAAGAQPAIVLTVPAGYKAKIMALSTSLTTDANVADRYPYVAIAWVAGGATYYFIQGVPITASITTQNVSFAAGASPGGAIGNNLVYTSPIGTEVEVPAGGTVLLNYLNLQATDDSALVRCFYKLGVVTP